MANSNTVNLRVALDGAKEAASGFDAVGQSLDHVRGQAVEFMKGLAGYDIFKEGLNAIKEMLGGFLDVSNATEQYSTRLQVLLGSQQEGNRLFNEMTSYASKVPFQFNDIMRSATNLAGVMGGGVDEIKQWMPLIGDLAAASGLSIEETTGQVIRMYSAGAGAADLFRERGVLAMMGFKAGVAYSVDETRQKMMDAWDSANSKFKGATTALATTWAGTMSMLEDKWYLFRDRIMKAGVFDGLKGVLGTVNDALGVVVTHMDDVKVAAGGVVAALTAGAILKAPAVIAGVATAVEALTAAMAANPIGAFTAAMATLLPVVAVAGHNIGKKFWDAVLPDARPDELTQTQRDWEEMQAQMKRKSEETASAIADSNKKIVDALFNDKDEENKLKELSTAMQEIRDRMDLAGIPDQWKQLIELEQKQRDEIEKLKDLGADKAQLGEVAAVQAIAHEKVLTDLMRQEEETRSNAEADRIEGTRKYWQAQIGESQASMESQVQDIEQWVTAAQQAYQAAENKAKGYYSQSAQWAQLLNGGRAFLNGGKAQPLDKEALVSALDSAYNSSDFTRISSVLKQAQEYMQRTGDTFNIVDHYKDLLDHVESLRDRAREAAQQQEAWADTLQSSIQTAQGQIDILKGGVGDLSKALSALSVTLDISQAQAAITQISNMIANLQTQVKNDPGANYIINFYGHGSETMPISSKIQSIQDDINTAFSSPVDQVVNFKGSGASALDSGSISEVLGKLVEAKAQLAQWDSQAWGYGSSMWAGPQKVILKSQISSYEDILRSSGYGGGSTQPVVVPSGAGGNSVTVGPIYINGQSTPEAKQLEQDIADSISTGRSPIVAALRKAGVEL